MKITEIDIDRFRIWRSLLLRLNPTGLNVIYGPNEAGKTTLMKCIMGEESVRDGKLLYRVDGDASSNEPLDLTRRKLEERARLGEAAFRLGNDEGDGGAEKSEQPQIGGKKGGMDKRHGRKNQTAEDRLFCRFHENAAG